MKLEYYGWDDGTSLYHFGILGQKWGVRRWQNADGSFNEEGKIRYGRVSLAKRRQRKFQNPDGSLTEKGKKYYGKLVSKQIYRNVNEAYDTVRNMYADKVSSAQINNLKSLLANYRATPFMDPWDSDEYQNVGRLAYKDAFNWLKNNDPEYLNEIIRLNNGSKDNLDAFHDFRKMVEGYSDERYNEADIKWAKNHPEAESINEIHDNAYRQYMDAHDSLVSKLTPNSDPIIKTETGKNQHGWHEDRRLSQYLSQMITDMENNQLTKLNW